MSVIPESCSNKMSSSEVSQLAQEHLFEIPFVVVHHVIDFSELIVTVLLSVSLLKRKSGIKWSD